MSASFVLFLLLGIGLVVGVLVVAYKLEQKRRDRLMLWCVNRGWSYVGEDPSLVGRFQGTPFGQGDRRRARNVVTGTEQGRPFTAFDYSYETHSTDSNGHRNTSTHRFAVYVVGLPAYLPTLQVAPEDAFRRLAGAVGLMRDIKLESEAFNRRFTVQAENSKFASDVLTPRTMEYLLSLPPAPWRIEGPAMLRWESGRMDPADVVEATAMLDRVADGIPAFVWKDHGHDPQRH